ncbi:MAG: NAD(P)H-dependent oxidoreductase [Parcubacteria group bacterium]|nr:NAD(P)H-dependent oxidoreductase [Parcubacteria group bacterium]
MSNPKTILEAFTWRYATQKFDTSKKLSDEQLNTLLEVIRLSPSSFGLQPWKFIVVRNPELRVKLRGAGYDQSKITDASHLIIFAVKKNLDDKTVDTYIQSVAQVRGVAFETLKGYGDMIKQFLSSMSQEAKMEWAARQAYIALGVLITAGAVEGIDVGPMEGFDPKKFDEILGLEQMGLETKVIVAVGFRSDDDFPASLTKVRFPKEEVIIEMN